MDRESIKKLIVTVILITVLVFVAGVFNMAIRPYRPSWLSWSTPGELLAFFAVLTLAAVATVVMVRGGRLAYYRWWGP